MAIGDLLREALMQRRYAIWKGGVYIKTELLTPTEVDQLKSEGYTVYDIGKYDEC